MSYFNQNIKEKMMNEEEISQSKTENLIFKFLSVTSRFVDAVWDPENQTLEEVKKNAQFIDKRRDGLVTFFNQRKYNELPYEKIFYARYIFEGVVCKCTFSSYFNHPYNIREMNQCLDCDRYFDIPNLQNSVCYKCHHKNHSPVRINASSVIERRNPEILVDTAGQQWHLAETSELIVGREVLFTKRVRDEQTIGTIEKINKKTVIVKAEDKREKYKAGRLFKVEIPCLYVWDDDDDDEPTTIKGEIN
tara:strand:- start:25 stop:768 length:744 start_codon:yes stop_codon:yes gene_type:complete